MSASISTDATIGAQLLGLKARSGLSLDEIARRGGYQGRSSIQRFFSARFDPKFLRPDVIDRLKNALIGTGDPKIEAKDFVFTKQSQLFQPLFEDHKIQLMYSSPPHAVAADKHGHVFETFSLSPALTVSAPAISSLNRLLAIHLKTTAEDSSRYRHGETIVVDFSRVPSPGSDVLLSFERDILGWPLHGFGRLVSASETTIVVQQSLTVHRFEFDVSVVADVGKVLNGFDMLMRVRDG